jgi:integrase
MAAKSKRQLPFNTQAVLKATALGGIATEYRVSGVRGLVLRVMPTGIATYIFTYQVPLGPKRRFRKLKLGRRDGMTLHDARARTEELRLRVEAGADPAAEAADRRSSLTFRELMRQRLGNGMSARKSGFPLAQKTLEEYRRSLDAYVVPAIGDHFAEDVTAEQVAHILDAIEDHGALVLADRTRAAIGSCYKWGLKRRLVRHDPTAGLGNRAPEIPKDRVFDDTEIRVIWRALNSSAISEPITLIIKLAVFLGKRRSEIARARRDGLILDGDTPTWTIRGPRRDRGRIIRGDSKPQTEDVIFLPRQAVALFRRALELTVGSEWVFPSSSSASKSPTIHPDSVSNAIKRLRSRNEGLLVEASLHTARRTMATRLSEELGVDDRLIERLLNHTPQDITRRRYNRGRPGGLMREALQRWADHVSVIVGEG